MHTWGPDDQTKTEVNYPNTPYTHADPRCLKITEKVSFNIASVASYDYIFIKNPKNGQFGEFLKCDIFGDFQTLCTDDSAAQIKKSFRINRKVV